MKHTRTGRLHFQRRALAISLPLLMAVILLITGCATSGGDTASAFYGSDSTGAQGYALTGKITTPDGTQGISGVYCSLQGMAGSIYSARAVSDSQGNYSFSGLPAGRYRLVTSIDGYYSLTTILSVDSEKSLNLILIGKNDWAAVCGTSYPYDPAKAYIGVFVDVTEASQGTKAHLENGVTVQLTGNSRKGGVAKAFINDGYLDGSGVVQWDATSTFDNGVAIFCGVTPGETHTIRAQKNGDTFDTITDASPEAGELICYVVNGRHTDANNLVPQSSPFSYPVGINYESWPMGRTGYKINDDLDTVTADFKLIRTYHARAVGTDQAIIEPTQKTVIDYMTSNPDKALELAMGTNNDDLFINTDWPGTTYGPGYMTNLISGSYSDDFVQMIIDAFGSVDATKTYLKVILLGNEVDCNGPVPANANYDNYYKKWFPAAFNNLKASLAAKGLDSIPVSTTIANYPQSESQNKVAYNVTKHIYEHWSPGWNNGKPFVLFNQYTMPASSTDFSHVTSYIDTVYGQLQGNCDVYVGETGYSAENGLANEANVISQLFAWLEGQRTANPSQSVRNTPLFVFMAFDSPGKPAGQQQMGIYAQDGSFKPTGLKDGITVPSWVGTKQ